jgi:predicted enzyme related to lactoylglutathione lyase
MSHEDRYIAGVPCWIDIEQQDPDAAVAFYGDLFGWEYENVMPAGGPGKYYMARIGGGDVPGIGSPPPGAPSNPAWNTYIWVEDADATAAKVREAGGGVVMEPMDVSDAGRTGRFTDPEGAVFSIWQPGRHRGATVVNEHGSLNFNTLSTRDVEGAKAFYGAVFGWELLDIAGHMWALPAYGDFLEARTPGLRARMREMGGPTRFEEVVAGLSPLADDSPAFWGVTFAVEDADATAARAAELGGRVLAGPFDAPWVRMAVIADPQGATFTASQFVPENRDLGAAAATGS